MSSARRRFLKLTGGMLGAMTVPAAGFGAAGLEELARQLLLELHAPALQPFLAAWPLAKAPQRRIDPASQPVLRYLPQLAAAAKPFAVEFVRALSERASMLAWRQSYTPAEVGAAFLQNYAWAELVGLSGATASEHLACGVLLLGPNTAYPPHRHEAEEIYVPLVGRALWQRGQGAFHAEEEGAIIHHDPFEPHAMRTEAAPLLALYLWRSRNLAQKSQLIPANR